MSKEKSKKLLFSITKNDFRIDTFRSGGKGGQHQNKTNSGVRITHIASGAVGECREHRSQHQNKQEAFMRLVNSEKFKKWHKIECSKRLGRLAEIEREVEIAMQPQNIRIEVKNENGRWIEDNKVMTE